MSNVTTDDVQRLAVLSNLQLTDAELSSLTADIDGILGYIEQLSDLDTDGIEPTYQVTGLSNVWRDDTVNQGDVSREQLLALAGEQKDDQVKVPKVL